MHVVMVTNVIAPDKLGGLERYVRELARSLVEADCQVTVIAKRRSPDYPSEEVGDDGVRILRHSVPHKRDPSFALRYPWIAARAVQRALHEVAAGKETVLHGHFAVPALALAMRRSGYLMTQHGPVHQELLDERHGSYFLPRPVQRAAVAGLRAAEAFVLRRAAAVVTLSEYMRTEVSSLDAGAGARTRIISGGIDTTRFSPGPGAEDPWGREADPLLFVARRLVPRTGVREMVQAMPQILRAMPRARLAIAGDGHSKGQVEDAIRGLGLHESVRLLGRISDDDLVAWYRSADLVVMPTQELEGFGLATAEALACGTPTLVTPTSANPELVRPLSDRLVAAASTPEAIADAVISLCADKRELDRVRAAARDRVHPAFSWTEVAARHLELYRALLLSGTQRHDLAGRNSGTAR